MQQSANLPVVNQSNQPQKSGRGGRRPGAGRPPAVGLRATPKQKRTLAELAKVYAPGALKVLGEVCSDKTAPSAARVQAAAHLLDRAYGRPPQTLEHTGAGGGPILQAVLSFEGEAALAEAMKYLASVERDVGLLDDQSEKH